MGFELCTLKHKMRSVVIAGRVFFNSTCQLLEALAVFCLNRTILSVSFLISLKFCLAMCWKSRNFALEKSRKALR